MTGNCHLSRPAIGNVAKFGLSLEEPDDFYISDKPRMLSWFGVASKSDSRPSCRIAIRLRGGIGRTSKSIGRARPKAPEAQD